MNPARSPQSTPSSASGKTTRNPPTKWAALVGGIAGTSIGLTSHFLLLDYLIVTLSLGLLYFIGITLLVDYMSILRQAPGDAGSWWAIAFGGTVGLDLMVKQLIYRPTVPDEIAIQQDFAPPKGAASISLELILILWLLTFGVALVSLTYGIAMAVADTSECNSPPPGLSERSDARSDAS